MIIRREQMDAFAEPTANEFERRTLLHVSKYFPDFCSELGPDGAAEFVRTAIRTAQDHDVLAERDVVLYVDLAVELDAGPDLASSYTWAAEILNDERPHGKIQELYAAARDRNLRPSGA